MRRFFVLLLICSLAVCRQGTALAGLVDNGNGTVTDNATGLVWQQGEIGTKAWDAALSYCNGLTLGGHSNWRLPSVSELESLTDDSRFNPVLDTAFFANFPNVVASYYWSSTTHAYGKGYAWDVVFFNGQVGFSSKNNDCYVRCVRGGQPGSLVSLTFAGSGEGSVTSNPAGIATNTDIAHEFEYGSAVTLTATRNQYSLFTGWSGACSGTAACALSLDADKSVTVTFNRNTAQQVRLDSTYYSTILAAYAAAASGKTIRTWGADFSENFTFNGGKAVTLEGGYDSEYTSNSGYTTLTGPVTIQRGSLTVENIIIR